MQGFCLLIVDPDDGLYDEIQVRFSKEITMKEMRLDQGSVSVQRLKKRGENSLYPEVSLITAEKHPFHISKFTDNGETVYIACSPNVRRILVGDAMLFNAATGQAYTIESYEEFESMTRSHHQTYSNAEKELILSMEEHGYMELSADQKSRLPVDLDGDEREMLVNHLLDKVSKRMLSRTNSTEFSACIDTGNTDSDKQSFVACFYGDWESPKDDILKSLGRQVGALFNGNLASRDRNWDRAPEWDGLRYDTQCYSIAVRPVMTITQKVYDEMMSGPSVEMKIGAWMG